MIVVEIHNKLQIGAAILAHQRNLITNHPLQLRFQDRWGGWLGTLTLTREDDEASEFRVEGFLFDSDKSIPLCFWAEPDGPADWPIRVVRGRAVFLYGGDSEGSPSADEIRAGFYADGCAWRKDNAPRAKSLQPEKRRNGAELSRRAGECEAHWAQTLINGGVKGRGQKRLDLLKELPESGEWPRRMPRATQSS